MSILRRDIGIQSRMLILILPLVAAPVLILAAVGFYSASREAEKSGVRYLAQRDADLRAVAEAPGILNYYINHRYGLTEEAEVARQELEESLKRLVERSNSGDLIYTQARFLDASGTLVAGASAEQAPTYPPIGDAETLASVKELPPGTVYVSPTGPTMFLAMPVYRTREGQAPRLMGAVALDFVYPLKDFRRTTAVILATLAVITATSIALALLLTVLVVRRLTNPVRHLADAANRIASGDRSTRVMHTSRDEIGQLASAFNAMSESLEADAAAIQRKIAETRTLYDIAQEITAQVDLEPTLQLIVDRGRNLLDGEVGVLALREEGTDTFAVQASQGRIAGPLTSLQVRAGEGLIGTVAESGKPRIVRDYLEEFSQSPFRKNMEEAGLHALVAVPLRAREAVTGVLLVASAQRGQFDEDDRQLLAALADHASIAIENARLLQQVRRHAEELEARVLARTRELQEANRRLEEASRHKSEFLANMSHELRTPLNAIIGFTRLVMRRTRDILPAKQYENMEKILISSDHLLQLINGILDLSKIEAGRMEVRPGVVNLAELVDGCLRTVEPLVKSDRLHLEKHIPDQLPALFTDGEKLKQILLNLLGNAIKFTEAGTIVVAVHDQGGTVTIDVSDTGIGIPEEALELIFEEFRQADSSSTRRYGGSGLGLSISRHFARLLGGEVTVRSQVGVGSTFTVTIPSHLRIAPALTGRDRTGDKQPANGKLVLAIDDDPDVIYLLRENLAEAGYRVVGALSGKDGLQKAKELTPYAITLDIMMPGMNGWEVLHQLKADAATRDIPVLVVSIVDNREMGYHLGASDYLLKPLDRDAVLSALGRVQRARGTLLVVDDDPMVADLVRQLLEGEPYEVVSVSDGEQALAALEREAPSVMLLDLLMPNMDGFELLKRLRTNPSWRDIPVIVLTAKHLETTEREALQRSVRRVIEKLGLDRDELVRELRCALEAYRPVAQTH